MSIAEVERVIDRAMPVDELIEILEQYRGKRVVITSDYGDHCHTEQVFTFDEGDIRELDHDECFRTTGYSRTGVQLSCPRNGIEEGEEGPRDVVVIRC